MNKRIEQLIEQADNIEILPDEEFCDTDFLADIDPRRVKKFAELIVQECAKICNDVGVAVFSEPVQNNLGTAQTCKVAIEKHFGIEE